MSIEILTPPGRFVQGSLTLENVIDQQTQKPKLDDQGQPIKQCFIGLAVSKADPQLPAFIAAIVAQAKADFPHLFDANGNCVHPQFAWKMQDGDGVDTTGKSVADKPGFAGHYIFKLATQFLPKCFHAGRYDAAMQIQNPAEIIKRGFYIRVSLVVRGNGVSPQDRQKKPGMFLSPNLVELIGYGPEIVGGPDASKVFGGAAPAALPAGASATPVAPTGALGNVGVPGLPAVGSPAPGSVPMAAPPAPAGVPGIPGAAAAPAGIPGAPAGVPGVVAAPLPPAPAAAPAAPRYVMTPAAMGNTREALIAQGWTDATLLAHGYMIQQG